MRSKPIDPQPIERVGIFPPRVWYTPSKPEPSFLQLVDPGSYILVDPSSGTDSTTGADLGSYRGSDASTDTGPYGSDDSRPDTEAHL